MPIRLISIALLFLSCVGQLFAGDTPPTSGIATAHPLATQAGKETFQAGGNAFDAAVAISAALAVVEPYSSGLGGGGFWLLHRASDQHNIMIDGRETAPGAAHRDMYLDENGDIINNLSLNGPLAAAIPGLPAALVHLAEKYGSLPLSRTLEPAIRLARNGFEVEKRYQRLAKFRLTALRNSAAATDVFLANGEVPTTGHLIKQPDLAGTLESLAKYGKAGFYKGKIAKTLVRGVREAGGIWTEQDLANYRVIEREPVEGHYKGIKVISAPPPSSGGIALIEMLNILAEDELSTLEPATQKHLIIEGMRRAYRDRAEYLGDPDYFDVPVKKLIHPYYGAALRNTIRLDRATSSATLPGVVTEPEGTHTTHFSVIDTAGNRVSATLTINFPFGSGFVSAGSGVLLNNEMDDFSSKPGIPNVYGLIGGEANAIEPGKRPLSSMTPTFLEDKNRTAILGTPGGSRIITMVLLASLDFAAKHNPESWVNVPRYHHQFIPDAITYEPDALAKDEIEALQALGHQLKPRRSTYGNMQAVMWDMTNNQVFAASDPRGIGNAITY
ncbi:MAG: gamma-glutamyltransferase [Gammaproteobacteria bacterium]